MKILMNNIEYDLVSLKEFPTEKDGVVRLEFTCRYNGRLYSFTFNDVIYREGDYYVQE